MLRVWILYEKNRRVLWFLLVAFSAEVITMLILSFYYDGPKFVHMEFMPIGCFAIGGRRHWTIFAIAPLTVSLIMFGMTMYRCRKTLRVSQGVGMPLFQLFLRDGILYFIAASPVLIAGLFMWRFARSTLSESLVGLYSMVTSRVLINIRTAVIEKTRRLTHTSAFDLMVLDISDGSVTMAENPPPRILCKDGADTA
ncbi:hypothetical protein CERSUDRAFT_125678 [Gelatoporia subvermispora B]|uniref:Uncharacterized protein n=1 Tax=Ceriporiopsis subvermispora (strain B) TaxID=914234 RepID=M2QP52_CERS8|nr:hypothetical protein CERSUDRAFT_125678 [Gelatoporia subvermispora B]